MQLVSIQGQGSCRHSSPSRSPEPTLDTHPPGNKLSPGGPLPREGLPHSSLHPSLPQPWRTGTPPALPFRMPVLRTVGPIDQLTSVAPAASPGPENHRARGRVRGVDEGMTPPAGIPPAGQDPAEMSPPWRLSPWVPRASHRHSSSCVTPPREVCLPPWLPSSLQASDATIKYGGGDRSVGGWRTDTWTDDREMYGRIGGENTSLLGGGLGFFFFFFPCRRL